MAAWADVHRQAVELAEVTWLGTSHSELAFETARESWGTAIGVFATRIDDSIGRVLVDEGVVGVPGDEVYRRENVGTTDLWGIEASLNHKIGGADSPLDARLSAAYVRGRQHDDLVGDVEARRIPPVSGSLVLGWRSADVVHHVSWADLSVHFALDQDQLHPQDESDPRIDPTGTDGWATLDLNLGGPLVEGAIWWMGVENILDENYRVHASGFDAPGRSIIFGIRVHI